MARLLITRDSLEDRPINLRLGVNRVGRPPDCEFQIDHSTLSAIHCELVLSPEGVLIRDCDSTNGTFVDCQPVKEAWLCVGQTVYLGEVKLLVENTEVIIAIPKFQPAGSPFPQTGVGSPVVMPPGTLVCSRHLQTVATYQCKTCEDLMCGTCVRTVKRQGGQALFLCASCGEKCERINFGPKKKKSFMDTLRRTVKLPFAALSGQLTQKK